MNAKGHQAGASGRTPDARPRCGLCGKTGRLARTPCCGNWICDDADKYVPFSYARNSCFRNHTMHTICGFHHNEGHDGRWQDCVKCREGEPLEMYVYHATNEYNFEKLQNPPAFEPTYCSDCGVIIRLSTDGYMVRGKEFFCDACTARSTGQTSGEVHAKFFSPPAEAEAPARPGRTTGDYPIGTIAYYGPDNLVATKLVAAVVKTPGAEPGPLHRWITQAGDVRQDSATAAAVKAFFRQHGVKHTVSSERIIGCPHEEGVDYPRGGVCPLCPFWHNRDRFTHEVLPPPPEMTPAHILAELASVRDRQPREALIAADAHREALTEPLLRAVERGVSDPTGTPPGEGMLFSFATYLLAKWREPRAYPLFVRWLSLPGEGAFEIGGDTVTQDGGCFLASVCAGNPEPIKGLILNRDANEFCRAQAVVAIATLAAWRELTHKDVTEYFLWLAHEGLEREHGQVWNELAATCADLEALPVFPELRRAYSEGLIETGFMKPDELDEVELGPRGSWWERYRHWHQPITDVARRISWWQCFQDDPVLKAEREKIISQLDAPPPKPFRAAPRIGRNDPCPCGSGKKYKKCCGR
jgi:Protein of unknown function (DUF1186)/SEC-C motif